MNKAKQILNLLSENLSDEVDLLVDRYGLKRYAPKSRSNAKRIYVGKIENEVNVQVEDFGSFVNVTVVFGELRDSDSGPMGSKGVASASGHVQSGKPVSGQGLPGNEAQGLKWRISGILPKGRTSAPSVKDGYLISSDIIDDLMNLRDKVKQGSAAVGDLSVWDDAKTGWN